MNHISDFNLANVVIMYCRDPSYQCVAVPGITIAFNCAYNLTFEDCKGQLVRNKNTFTSTIYLLNS